MVVVRQRVVITLVTVSLLLARQQACGPASTRNMGNVHMTLPAANTTGMQAPQNACAWTHRRPPKIVSRREGEPGSQNLAEGSRGCASESKRLGGKPARNKLTLTLGVDTPLQTRSCRRPLAASGGGRGRRRAGQDLVASAAPQAQRAQRAARHAHCAAHLLRAQQCDGRRGRRHRRGAAARRGHIQLDAHQVRHLRPRGSVRPRTRHCSGRCGHTSGARRQPHRRRPQGATVMHEHGCIPACT